MANRFRDASDPYNLKTLRNADIRRAAARDDALFEAEPPDLGETKLCRCYCAQLARKSDLTECGNAVAYRGVSKAGGDR
jgi:hypothetical protein